MTAKDIITTTITMTHGMTRDYLKDMSDAELLVRTSPAANHLAWQLGHLIASEHEMISALGHPMPELPAGFVQRHGKETAGENDPAKFGSKDEYLALFQKVHDGTLAALRATPDADLDRPAPEKMRSYAPKIGDVFNLCGLHEMMHSGQFVSVRRKLGKPVLF